MRVVFDHFKEHFNSQKRLFTARYFVIANSDVSVALFAGQYNFH